MIQVSFSGGRSSAMMAKIMLENYDRNELIFTFANTGKEMPETLDFVHECDVRWGLNTVWVEYCPENKFKVVDYESADRSGMAFELLAEKKKYLPNRVTRFCTTELKIKPMERYLRSIGFDSWDCAVGIRHDEDNRYRRMKGKAPERWEYIFPLYDFKITKKQVHEFWKQQPFDLQIPSEHGNCDFCFMKGLAKKVAQAKQMPQKLDWWIDIERKTGKRFTNDYSYQDIKTLALQPELFNTQKNEPEISCFCGD